MNCVKFKKDGLYSKTYDENGVETKWTKVKGPIYLHFQSVVEFDKKLTLGDLMHVLIMHEVDIDAMFMGVTRGRRMRPYYEEMLQVPTGKRSDLSHVEFAWVADYYKSDSQNDDNALYINLQVTGISKKSEEATYHSLSRATLNDWKHLRVELNDNMIVNEFIESYQTETGKTEMHVVTILEARKEITLYDLIAGLLAELTIYGYPDQRRDHIVEINNAIDEVQGTVSTETLKEKEKELQEAIDSENYERAAMLKSEIDNIKKFLK